MGFLNDSLKFTKSVFDGSLIRGIGGGDTKNILLSMIPGVGSYLAGKEVTEGNIQSAREQMDFQEYMSNTAHQREVADLKAAGLNPVLSVDSGASTPVGAGYQTESGYSGIGEIVSTALQMKKLRQDIEESRSRVDSNKAQAAAVRAGMPMIESQAQTATVMRDFKKSLIDSFKEFMKKEDKIELEENDRNRYKFYRKPDIPFK